jgi:uncharacterized delta-60 repeat protein
VRTRRTIRRLATTLGLLFGIVFVVPAGATPGDLDSSFSDNGWVRTIEVTSESNNYLPKGVEDLVVQPDGKIVVVGEIEDGTSEWYFGAFRYSADGSLDPSFGEGGWVDTDIGGFDFPHAVALQGNKIIVAGETDCQFAECFALVRYHSDGTLDTTFGNEGVVKTTFAQCGCAAYDVAVSERGKIVAAGYRFKYGDHMDDGLFAAARYLPDGDLDEGFSADGKVSVDFGFGDDIAEAVAVLPRGKVLLAGSGTKDWYRTRDDFALAQFRNNGSLDPNFSGDGLRTIDFGSARADSAHDVALQLHGRIVVAGSTTAGSVGGPKIALTRLHPDGSLDRGFGLRRTRPGSHGGYAEAVVAHPDGTILVGGRAFEDAERDSSDWVIARHLVGGGLDPTWSGNGMARTNLSAGADEIGALGIQADGLIVASGSISGSQGVARYLND